MSRIAVLIPCYKRPDYTRLCLQSVLEAGPYKDVKFYLFDDGSNDGTLEILSEFAQKLENNALKVDVYVRFRKENSGLRNSILDFFEYVLDGNNPNRFLKGMIGGCLYPIDYITKIDNDCIVPKNWLRDLTRILESAKADILSPNVSESNAAHKYGALHKREGDFIPSQIVGGLWFMRREMIEGLYFERFGSTGIRAAFNLIHQIVAEKEPKIGWTDAVTYEDVGYWYGTHAKHVKSLDHAAYSHEVGRAIKWHPEVPA